MRVRTHLRNRNNGIVAGVVVLLAAMTLVTDVQAQPGPRGLDGPFMGGGPRGMLPGLRDLDLTDAQREQVRSIAEQNRDAGGARAEQLATARAALHEAVMAEVVNETTIRTLPDDLATLEADAAVQRAHVNAEIWQVLTPGQRAELRELQAEVKEQVAERRGRRRGQRR